LRHEQVRLSLVANDVKGKREDGFNYNEVGDYTSASANVGGGYRFSSHDCRRAGVHAR
jgi:hypothetical protein